jgi:hypothetical protein
MARSSSLPCSRLHPADAGTVIVFLLEWLDAKLAQCGDDLVECPLCHMTVPEFGRDQDFGVDLAPVTPRIASKPWSTRREAVHAKAVKVDSFRAIWS